MPKQAANPDPQYLDEHHQRITEFAADYFDDDEERDVFVDTLMERRGYQRQNSWAPPAAPDPDPTPASGDTPASPKRPGYFKR
jgi:hypothetical protein